MENPRQKLVMKFSDPRPPKRKHQAKVIPKFHVRLTDDIEMSGEWLAGVWRVMVTDGKTREKKTSYGVRPDLLESLKAALTELRPMTTVLEADTARLRRENQNAGNIIHDIALALGTRDSSRENILTTITNFKKMAAANAGSVACNMTETCKERSARALKAIACIASTVDAPCRQEDLKEEIIVATVGARMNELRFLRNRHWSRPTPVGGGTKS